MLTKDGIFRLVLIALAMAACCAAIYLTGPENADFADSGDYIAAAKMLLNDGSYPTAGSLPFFRAPLYPFFMAAIWGGTGDSFLAVKLAQTVLHSATALLIFESGKFITRASLAAGIAACLVAINPLMVYHAAAIQTETLHTFLVTLGLSVLFSLVLSSQLRLSHAAIAGASFGLAALCKPSAFGVGLVMAATFLLLKRRQKGSFSAAAVMAGAMLMMILPWTLHNLKTTGEPILINDAGGYALWLGNHPDNLRIYEEGFNSRSEAEEYQDYLGKTLAARQVAEWNAGAGYESLSLSERSSLWRAKAIENARGYPAETARLMLWKFWGFWRPYLSSDIYSIKSVVLSAAMLISLYVFGLIGLIKTASDAGTRNVVFLFLILTVFVTFVHVLIVSTMRFRIPYIDPYLTLFAAIGLVQTGVKLGIVKLSLNKADAQSE